MTAEVAILNRSAVALAADSAATILGKRGNQKIYNTVNKLFALSKYSPVGFMVYGDADLMDVPWESIIKIFRQWLGKKSFPKLNDYANSFIHFIERNRLLFPEKAQEKFLRIRIGTHYFALTEEIDKEVKEIITKDGSISRKKLSVVVNNIIAKDATRTYKAKLLKLGKRYEIDISRKYGRIIKEIIDEIFQNHPLGSSKIILYKIGLDLFCRDIYYWPGFVISGFGEKETFPSIYEFQIDGIINNKLRYIVNKTKSGSIGKKGRSAVLSFAQEDEVQTFKSGVHPEYIDEIIKYLSMLLLTVYPVVLSKNMKNVTTKQKKQFARKLEKAGDKFNVSSHWNIPPYFLQDRISRLKV